MAGQRPITDRPAHFRLRSVQPSRARHQLRYRDIGGHLQADCVKAIGLTISRAELCPVFTENPRPALPFHMVARHWHSLFAGTFS